MAEAAVFDPLTTAAPLARSLAAALCEPEGAEQPCAWYHGVWPYLRIVGVAASPDRHAAFYATALTAIARQGTHGRVLVSGCADYSMVAHLLAAYRAGGGEPDVTVLDRCATPTALSQWYGHRVGIGTAAAVSDIMTFSVADPFDVICTHSFLSQFPLAARDALIDRWRALLCPGGKVVTTTRITAGAGEAELRFTDEQAADFAERVLHEAESRRGELDMGAAELASAALRYAERTVAYPTPDVDGVVKLFERGGFDLAQVNARRLAAASAGASSGPGTAQAADYAEIVAVRA